MAFYEIFSKRMKRLTQGDQPDVYQYDELPAPFRIQVIHIWNDAIGHYTTYQAHKGDYEPHWELIHDTLARELGLFSLGDRHHLIHGQCKTFLMTADTSGALDIIEL